MTEQDGTPIDDSDIVFDTCETAEIVASHAVMFVPNGKMITVTQEMIDFEDEDGCCPYADLEVGQVIEDVDVIVAELTDDGRRVYRRDR